MSTHIDGAAWAAAQIRVGMQGMGGVIHHHERNWMWERTRNTLAYALQGMRVQSRRTPYGVAS